MRCLLSLFIYILFLLFSPVLVAQQVFYFPQIGDGTAGTLQFNTEVFLVATGSDSQITLDFFDRKGDPLVLQFGDETASSFTFELLTGQSFSRKTSGTSNLQVGYARVTSSSSGVGGTAVFTGVDAPSGVVLFEAGVPASEPLDNFTVIVDSLGRRDTGLAVVRPRETVSAQFDDLLFTLYDSNFTQIATTDVPLQEGAGIAKFVNEFFPDDPDVRAHASEMRGILTVQGPELAAVTLRQNVPAQRFPDGVPTLTAFPVNPGVPELALASNQASLLSDGQIQVAVVLGEFAQQASSIDYRLWSGARLVGEFRRNLSGYLVSVHRLRGNDGSRVTRLEAVLRDSRGAVIEHFELLP